MGSACDTCGGKVCAGCCHVYDDNHKHGDYMERYSRKREKEMMSDGLDFESLPKKERSQTHDDVNNNSSAPF